MIIERQNISKIARYAQEHIGMNCIAKNALQKVSDGITTASEVEREVFF